MGDPMHKSIRVQVTVRDNRFIMGENRVATGPEVFAAIALRPFLVGQGR